MKIWKKKTHTHTNTQNSLLIRPREYTKLIFNASCSRYQDLSVFYLINSEDMLSTCRVGVKWSFIVLHIVKLSCIRKTKRAPQNDGSIQWCWCKHAVFWSKKKSEVDTFFNNFILTCTCRSICNKLITNIYYSKPHLFEQCKLIYLSSGVSFGFKTQVSQF